jgi:hypothetical protein
MWNLFGADSKRFWLKKPCRMAQDQGSRAGLYAMYSRKSEFL